MTGPVLDALAQSAVDRWGGDAARAASQADAGDAPAPAVVLEPPDAATLREMLRWAHADGLPLLVRGAGTKLAWAPSPPCRAILSTLRLTGTIDHCAGDLTVTVPAGARLSAVNGILAHERQRLPLDPRRADRATIGGIVAANDSGPRRLLHGTPRDLIIGVEMALADGRSAKGGGRVVKNVAGYDLPRLLCGSFGSLAVITAATFKLAPIPPSSRTIVATADRARPLADLALAIAASPNAPSSIEIDGGAGRLLVRIESTEAAAERQAQAVQEICSARGLSASALAGEPEAEAWRSYADALDGDDGTLVKVAVLPTQVPDVIEHTERVAVRFELASQVAGRAALGVLYVRLKAGPPRAGNGSERGTRDAREAAAADELRQNAWARGGSAVIVSAGRGVRALADAWGDVGDALPLMRAVKRRFDPKNILNPGRGPGGL